MNTTMKNENFSPEMLNFVMEQANLNMDDVLKKMNDMRRDKILKQHKEKYNVWLASDGRWKTKLPTDTGKDILIAKTTLENLENSIVKHYKSLEEPETDTLKAIYSKFIEYKCLSCCKATANKLQWVWNTYYKDSDIVNVKFQKMTVGYITDWLLKLIDERQLEKKRYTEIKGLLNQLYDYCIRHDLVQINLPRQIHLPSKNIFSEPDPKPEEEIIYSIETKREVIYEALSQFEKTKNTAYLAICLNFNLGLRVGELVALRESDIDGDIIHITKGEVKTYIKDENGVLHANGFEVAKHPKTDAGIRDLPLTPDAKKYIKMAIDENKANGRSDEDYIFLDQKRGKRMHEYAVNNVLRRCNGVRNEKDRFIISGKPSGNHAIRKTCISDLHDSQSLPDRMISDFAGHKDISTTQKHYIHTVTKLSEKADVFTQVFSI